VRRGECDSTMVRRRVGLLVAGAVVASAGMAFAENLAGAAYSTCQMFALDRLPRPETARFPSLGERGTSSRSGAGSSRTERYEVTSFVDFKNERGDRVRYRLYCSLHTGGPNRWVLDQLLIGNGERTVLEREQARRRATAEAARRRRELTDWMAAEFEKDEREAKRLRRSTE